MTTCNQECRREHQILARAPRSKSSGNEVERGREREREMCCGATKRCRETLIVYYVSLWSRFSTRKKNKNYKSTHVECWPKMKINSKRGQEKKIISKFMLYQFLFISVCFFSHFFFSFLFALVPHKSSSAMICEWGYFMRCILLCCLENQFVVLGSEGMQRIIGERWTRTRDAKKKHNKLVLYISEQE